MFHIILNPVSGNKKASKNFRKVEKTLQQRGVAYELHETYAAREAEAIARELTLKGETEIIVFGGDGTLHEVLNGLVDPAVCTIGLVPSGTGNDFVAALGLPLKPEEAILRILDGAAKPIDYLQVGERRCMNIGGVGMDVDVLVHCAENNTKGKLKYIMQLLKSIYTYKGCPITVYRDGEEDKTYNAFLAAACNGQQFGGGVRICPAANVDDGKIHVVIVDVIEKKWTLTKTLVKLLRGKILDNPCCTHYLCEKVRFVPNEPCTYQLDGELYQSEDIEIQVCQGLRMYR